jgi:hypothetical protein
VSDAASWDRVMIRMDLGGRDDVVELKRRRQSCQERHEAMGKTFLRDELDIAVDQRTGGLVGIFRLYFHLPGEPW